IPNAALAALLIITGYRLASPRVFKETYQIGAEQIIIFCITIIATLKTDLLCGVAIGVVTELLMHLYHGAPIADLFKTHVTVSDHAGVRCVVSISGCAVFSNYIQLKRKLDKLPRGIEVVIDLSRTKLVDHTVMERLHQYGSEYGRSGGSLLLSGLEDHKSKS